MKAEDIKILKEASIQDPFFVLYKPSGLPSAPLYEGDDSALTRLLKLYPELKNVSGEKFGRKNVEHGLIHRIDTLTSGLLLIAANEDAFASILQSQSEGKFINAYSAVCNHNKESAKRLGGFPPCDTKLEKVLTCMNKCTIYSDFRKFGPKGAQVRPLQGTSYCTEVTLTQENDQMFNASCKITKGYRHQVRCHLSWLGFPIVGDPIYNPETKNTENSSFYFTADYISFPHPVTGTTVTYSLD